ncbi:MAG: hypothetical protein EON61_10285 [Alphaproteobacteria bacterium]|nr:MAG: hypothetical protein EON61_10285 [Alphaproteobacteria bacterium]
MPSKALLSKLKGYFAVTHDLRTDINALAKKRINLDAGDALIRAGDKYKCMFLVEEGWLLRARYLPGGTRQIVNFWSRRAGCCAHAICRAARGRS